MSAEGPTDSKLGTGLIILLVVTMALHALGTVRLIGTASLIDGAPLASYDWSHHSANAWTARKLWDESSRLSGFVPSSMGGYPFGTADSVSNRLGEIATAWLPIPSAPQAFALIVLLLLVLAPLWPAVAAHRLGARGAEIVGAALLGVALVWRAVDGPRPFLELGLYGYLHGLALAPAAITLALASARVSSAVAAAAATLIMLGWLSHVLFPILVAPGILAGALALARTPSPTRGWVAPLAAASLGAVAASPFWYPLIRFRDHLRLGTPRFLQDGLGAVFGELASLFALVWLLGAVGLVVVVRSGRGPHAVALAIGTMTLLGLSVSTAPAVAALQPERFVDGVTWLLAPAAPIGVAALARSVGRAILPVAAAILLLVPSLETMVGQAFGLREPLIAWNQARGDERLSWDVTALPSAVARATPGDSRILIEESSTWSTERATIWGPILLPALLPHLVEREVIGGPLPDSRLREAHAGFIDGFLFGRRVQDWAPSELEGELDQWNIAAVVAWSPEAISALERLPRLGRPEMVGRFALFVMAEPRRCFALPDPSGACPADASARPGRIVVTPHRPGEIVLAWHWNERLAGEDEATLGRALVGDDPVGLIAVQSSGRAFEIRQR